MNDAIQISVTYERKLSDGNYGSEGCSLTWTGPHDEAYGDIASALRVQVLAFLSRSGAWRVADTAAHELSPSKTDPRDGVPVTTAPRDWDDAAQASLASAEYELQAGLRDAYAQADEDDPL